MAIELLVSRPPTFPMRLTRLGLACVGRSVSAKQTGEIDFDEVCDFDCQSDRDRRRIPKGT
jgi:hypothetical protein